jgi:hypothetical protein
MSSAYPVDLQLTDEQMLEIARNAFLPYRCVPDFTNDGEIFGFAVRYSEEGVPEKRKVWEDNATRMRNASTLKLYLELARKDLEKLDITLNEWEFPIS